MLRSHAAAARAAALLSAAWRGVPPELARAVGAPARAAASSLPGSRQRTTWTLRGKSTSAARPDAAPDLELTPPPPLCSPPQGVPRDAPTATSAGGAAVASEDNESALDVVQHFVEAIHSQGDLSAEFADGVVEELDRYFVALSQARARKRVRHGAEDRELREGQIFAQRVDNLFARKLAKARVPDELRVRDGLKALLQLCLGHLELLYQALHTEEQGAGGGAILGHRSKRKLSESTPLYENFVFDIHASWNGVRNFDSTTGSRSPLVERTILLANLPSDASEEQIRGALAPCGELRTFEMCGEWPAWAERRRMGVAAEGRQVVDSEASAAVVPATWDHSSLYAIAEFAEESGYRRATRAAVRLFGILMTEVCIMKTRANKEKPVKVGRPMHPQAAAHKRTLLLRGLPFHVGPAEVLRACIDALSGPCVLQLANCGAFGLERLVAERSSSAEAARVESLPEFPTPDIPPGSRAAVLRFDSFEQAYMARQALRGFTLAQRPLVVGFPPWRPVVLTADSTGRPLSREVILDLPMRRANALYPAAADDPARKFGVPLVHGQPEP